MTDHARELFDLLPAIHRIRDARLAQEQGLDRGPLEELVAVMAAEIAVMAESLEQLHDDLFIETCAEWVVPYIGDEVAATAQRVEGVEAVHVLDLYREGDPVSLTPRIFARMPVASLGDIPDPAELLTLSDAPVLLEAMA